MICRALAVAPGECVETIQSKSGDVNPPFLTFYMELIVTARPREIAMIHPARTIVSLVPIKRMSMAIEVVHIAVEVREKAMAVPSGKPWLTNGRRKSTSAPWQK
jgi:hypothetical protein